jgi:hypothetical protein
MGLSLNGSPGGTTSECQSDERSRAPSTVISDTASGLQSQFLRMRTDLLPLCDKDYSAMNPSIAPVAHDSSVGYFRVTTNGDSHQDWKAHAPSEA